MAASIVYATVTALVGVILLLGWLYLTTGNPRSTTLLLKSILMFVLPGAALLMLPPAWFAFPLGLWVVVLIEECIKATAATTERGHSDRFLLLILFGVWEFTIGKPIWGVFHSAAVDRLSGLQIMALIGAGLITVLMHAVTGVIYSFRLKSLVIVALPVCWLIHTLFDESVDLLGTSLLSSLLRLALLLILLNGLWPKRMNVVRGDNSSR